MRSRLFGARLLKLGSISEEWIEAYILWSVVVLGLPGAIIFKAMVMFRIEGSRSLYLSDRPPRAVLHFLSLFGTQQICTLLNLFTPCVHLAGAVSFAHHFSAKLALDNKE